MFLDRAYLRKKTLKDLHHGDINVLEWVTKLFPLLKLGVLSGVALSLFGPFINAFAATWSLKFVKMLPSQSAPEGEEKNATGGEKVLEGEEKDSMAGGKQPEGKEENSRGED